MSDTKLVQLRCPGCNSPAVKKIEGQLYLCTACGSQLVLEIAGVPQLVEPETPSEDEVEIIENEEEDVKDETENEDNDSEDEKTKKANASGCLGDFLTLLYFIAVICIISFSYPLQIGVTIATAIYVFVYMSFAYESDTYSSSDVAFYLSTIILCCLLTSVILGMVAPIFGAQMIAVIVGILATLALLLLGVFVNVIVHPGQEAPADEATS